MAKHTHTHTHTHTRTHTHTHTHTHTIADHLLCSLSLVRSSTLVCEITRTFLCQTRSTLRYQQSVHCAKNNLLFYRIYYNLDLDKLKTVPSDLGKLTNAVDNDVAKKTAYDKLVVKFNAIGTRY